MRIRRGKETGSALKRHALQILNINYSSIDFGLVNLEDIEDEIAFF